MSNTIQLTANDFENTIQSGLSLVDFYADWCMPCRMLAPTIAAVADEFEGKAKVCKINIDDAQEIAAKYGIMNIPTVILFKDGKQVDQKVGMGNKSQYEEMINAQL
ncbi:MAG: thioredoxin [Clostridiaceae bacterium]|nr:thioredoxin [Clostridiaceae bacterium]